MTTWFDDEKGIAFLERMRIYSDPLSELRHDKVMPLWPEEHLLTANLLGNELKRGQYVLDIGTGSGVFAIQAARIGCRVVAIDANARALDRAYKNAKINEVDIVKIDKIAYNNKLVLLHKCITADTDILSELDSFPVDYFDAVIITPPYNPTFHLLSPALHASAGGDGQSAFNQMLGSAVMCLKPGGKLICNQMSTVTKSGAVSALDRVQSEFRNNGLNARIVQYPAFSASRYISRDFLEGQYKEYLDATEKHDDWAHKQLASYIRRVSKESPFFELFSIVATAEPIDEHAATPPEIEVKSESSEISKNYERSWEDRIRLHRKIVKSSIPPRTISLAHMPNPVISGVNLLSVSSEIENESFNSDQDANRASKSEQAEKSLGNVRSTLGLDLDILDSESSVGNDCLDIVVVDAAPISENMLGIEGLNQELIIWFSKRLQNRIKDESNVLMTNLYESWQENTREQQELHVGPFQHPWFTGSATSANWTLMQHSIRISSENSPIGESNLVDSLLSPTNDFEAWVGHLPEAKKSDTKFAKFLQIGERMGGSISSLDKLDVEEPTLVAQKILSSARIGWILKARGGKYKPNQGTKPWAETLDFSNFIGESTNFDSLLDQMGLEDKVELQNVLYTDVDFCHRRMHKNIDLIVKKVFGRIASPKWTSLTGIPVRIREISARSVEREIPIQYRGGVWCYSCSLLGNEKPDLELLDDKVLSFSKTLWLTYIDRFGAQSVQEKVRIALHSAVHQVSHLVSGIRRRASDENVPDILKYSAYILEANLKLFEKIKRGEDFLAIPIPILELTECALLAGFIRIQKEVGLDGNELLRKEFREIRKLYQGKDMEVIGVLKEVIVAEIKKLPRKWEILEKDPAFIVIVYNLIWQSFYHSVIYNLTVKLKGGDPNSTDLEKHLKVEFIEENNKLKVVVENRGFEPSSRKEPTDAINIREFVKGMNGVLFENIEYDNETQLWRAGAIFNMV